MDKQNETDNLLAPDAVEIRFSNGQHVQLKIPNSDDIVFYEALRDPRFTPTQKNKILNVLWNRLLPEDEKQRLLKEVYDYNQRPKTL